MTRYVIDSNSSRVTYTGESWGVLAMKFNNDQSLTTGEIEYDSHALTIAGELRTQFEKVPGGRDTVGFRRALGIQKPHELHARKFRFYEDCIELELDMGRGAHDNQLRVETFEADAATLRIVAEARFPLDGAGDLFDVASQPAAIMITGVVDLRFELEARSAVH